MLQVGWPRVEHLGRGRRAFGSVEIATRATSRRHRLDAAPRAAARISGEARRRTPCLDLEAVDQSAGLWLEVITMPPPASCVRIAKPTTGVGAALVAEVHGDVVRREHLRHRRGEVLGREARVVADDHPALGEPARFEVLGGRLRRRRARCRT